MEILKLKLQGRVVFLSGEPYPGLAWSNSWMPLMLVNPPYFTPIWQICHCSASEIPCPDVRNQRLDCIRKKPRICRGPLRVAQLDQFDDPFHFLKKIFLYTIFDYTHIDWADAKATPATSSTEANVSRLRKSYNTGCKRFARSGKHRLTQLAGKTCKNYFCLGKEIRSWKACKMAKIYTIRILKEEI